MRSVVWSALAVAVADGLLRHLAGSGPHGWVMVAHVAVAAAVAALAPRRPVAALPAALVLALPGGGEALLAWTGFHAGLRIAAGRGLAVAALALLAFLAGRLLLAPAAPGQAVSATVVFVALPAVLGRCVAQFRGLRAAREASARQARRERALLAERERLHERLRIAGDVHDSLGHRLSLLSIQAAALEVAPLPARERQAVLDLAGTARRALDDLHDLVGGLREPGAAEPRSLEDLDGLADGLRAAGTPVTVLRDGYRARPAPVVAHTAYRVVEEGLTNAAKHAPGEPVTVAVRDEGDTLLVSVRNPLPPAPPAGPGRGGHGLAGLDERVRLAGGAFSTAATDGEFRIAAMLPLADAGTAAQEGGPATETFAGAVRLGALACALTAGALLVVAGPGG